MWGVFKAIYSVILFIFIYLTFLFHLDLFYIEIACRPTDAFARGIVDKKKLIQLMVDISCYFDFTLLTIDELKYLFPLSPLTGLC